MGGKKHGKKRKRSKDVEGDAKYNKRRRVSESEPPRRGKKDNDKDERKRVKSMVDRRLTIDMDNLNKNGYKPYIMYVYLSCDVIFIL